MEYRVVLPNGLELSCPAAQAAHDSLPRIPAGQAPSNSPHASRVSCSEVLGSRIGHRGEVLKSTPSFTSPMCSQKLVCRIASVPSQAAPYPKSIRLPVGIERGITGH
jgi:hypothetical protein